MSMHNTANSGYTVKVELLSKILPKDKTNQYEELCVDGDEDAILNFLQSNTPPTFPIPESIFCLNEESESTDLEIGELYAYFNESDLYIKTPTNELNTLIEKGVTPTFGSWVVFG